jgi:hypothetical protein
MKLLLSTGHMSRLSVSISNGSMRVWANTCVQSSEVEFDMGHILGHMTNKVLSQEMLCHLLRNKGGNAMPQINLSVNFL